MSLDTTSNLKQQLSTNLGPNAPTYFGYLQNFVTGKISRTEFEDVVTQILTTPTLLQLHNALIISLFDATATYKRNALNVSAGHHNSALTPPPMPTSKRATRKRRRTLLPYQGPHVSEDDRSLRSNRLKRWVLAVGRRERERIQSLQSINAPGTSSTSPNAMQVDGSSQPTVTLPQQVSAVARPRPELDEISCERGVTLMPERGGPPGGRPPIQLHSTTHAPTLQHIADRINLICAQHNLAPPTRSVPSLMSLACEAKLKQLITHAITLTLSSQAISSINLAQNPSSNLSSLALSGEQGLSSTSLASASTHHHLPQRTPILTAPAFQSLFTLYPASLPNKSAAAMRLASIPSSTVGVIPLNETAVANYYHQDDDSDDIPVLKDREVRDQRWQIMALLAERSTVRESLKAVR